MILLIDGFQALKNCGGNPNVRSNEGLTPVHVASIWGRCRMLELLLAYGGDPWLFDYEQQLIAEEWAIKERQWQACLVLSAHVMSANCGQQYLSGRQVGNVRVTQDQDNLSNSAWARTIAQVLPLHEKWLPIIDCHRRKTVVYETLEPPSKKNTRDLTPASKQTQVNAFRSSKLESSTSSRANQTAGRQNVHLYQSDGKQEEIRNSEDYTCGYSESTSFVNLSTPGSLENVSSTGFCCNSKNPTTTQRFPCYKDEYVSCSSQISSRDSCPSCTEEDPMYFHPEEHDKTKNVRKNSDYYYDRYYSSDSSPRKEESALERDSNIHLNSKMSKKNNKASISECPIKENTPIRLRGGFSGTRMNFKKSGKIKEYICSNFDLLSGLKKKPVMPTLDQMVEPTPIGSEGYVWEYSKSKSFIKSNNLGTVQRNSLTCKLSRNFNLFWKKLR